MLDELSCFFIHCVELHEFIINYHEFVINSFFNKNLWKIRDNSWIINVAKRSV